MNESVAVTVSILDREYRIACPKEEQPSLLEAAGHLDKRMREIRDSGRVIGLDRISVMAALNIANDYLDCRRQENEIDTRLAARLAALRQQMDSALEEFEEQDS